MQMSLTNNSKVRILVFERGIDIQIEKFFDDLMRWQYAGTYFDFTGRDAIAALIGFLSGIILVSIIIIISDTIEQERKNK